MTNKEAIDRWADSIIPVVFKAEDALKKAKPEWEERCASWEHQKAKTRTRWRRSIAVR